MDQFGEMNVFLHAVEQGSFSGAGRRLGMSPSAVSKLVARLEVRLNVRLFERVAGTIRLTQEGQTFREASQRVADAMADAEASVARADVPVSGVLHIHTALATAKYLLAPLVPQLLERHPGLRLEFVLGNERPDFARQGIDVAIHRGQPTELSLIGRPLMRHAWVVAAAPSYLARHGTPRTPQDLLAHRCLNFTLRKQWNSWTFRQDGITQSIEVPAQIGATQGELLHTLALMGLGVVRLGEFNIAQDLQAGRLVALLEPFRDENEDMFYVLYPQGRMPGPRVRAFVQFLGERFA